MAILFSRPGAELQHGTDGRWVETVDPYKLITSAPNFTEVETSTNGQSTHTGKGLLCLSLLRGRRRRITRPPAENRILFL